MTTRAQVIEAGRLWAAWQGTVELYKQDDCDAHVRAEQAAFDELVDYVEANDLNHTTYDPRP